MFFKRVNIKTGAGIVVAIVAAGMLVFYYNSVPETKDLLALYRDEARYGNLIIHYPLDETLFPPEIVPPEFHWEDGESRPNMWLVSIKFQDNEPPINVVTSESRWTPEPGQWETIKKRSQERDARVTILGFSHRLTTKII